MQARVHLDASAIPPPHNRRYLASPRADCSNTPPCALQGLYAALGLSPAPSSPLAASSGLPAAIRRCATFGDEPSEAGRRGLLPLQPNSFYVGDAIDFPNTRCAPDSIDLVLTSPPYDDLRLYQGYSFDAEQMLAAIYRGAKPGGVCVWVIGERIKD